MFRVQHYRVKNSRRELVCIAILETGISNVCICVSKIDYDASARGEITEPRIFLYPESDLERVDQPRP